MPWLVIFSIDYRPASHYSRWNALSSPRGSHSWIVFCSATTKSPCTACRPLMSIIDDCCLQFPPSLRIHAVCLTQYAALTDFTLTSILLSSKLDSYSFFSMLTYLLPFHHLRQGYPEAGSTFMGTRGREGGGGGPGFACSHALIDLV